MHGSTFSVEPYRVWTDATAHLVGWCKTVGDAAKNGVVFGKQVVGENVSHFYELKAGVRQGGVLSPIVFGIHIDVLVQLVKKANIGCKTGACCAGIFLYADDIILLTPSVQALQSLINICESELNSLCMAVNAKKICLFALWT